MTVDRSKQMLTDGSPVPPDRSHTADRGDGQQKEYIVLTDEERSKGWVKPYRESYRHKKCGAKTTMGRKIAETYARDPRFYSGTFCCECGAHFPLNEFHWTDGEPMDPDKQEAWCAERDVRVKREREEYRTRRITKLKQELARLEGEQP